MLRLMKLDEDGLKPEFKENIRWACLLFVICYFLLNFRLEADFCFQQLRELRVEQVVQGVAFVLLVDPVPEVQVEIVSNGAGNRRGKPDLLVGRLLVDDIASQSSELYREDPVL